MSWTKNIRHIIHKDELDKQIHYPNLRNNILLAVKATKE